MTMFEMNESKTLSEARTNLMKMPEILEGGEGVIPLTRHGKPVLAVMTWELYESISETIEVLSDPAMMAQLREQGKTVPWEEAKERLAKK